MAATAQAPGRGRVHPVDEVLPPDRLALYGVQHVLAFYAGAVIVPILLAGAIGLRGSDLVYLISADLFTCGIASIIQAVGFWKIGVRLPLLQGVTFTAVTPMITIGNSEGGGVHGLLAIYGAVIVAGVVTFFGAPYFSQLLHLFPPVVTGTVITVIGIALLPVAAGDAGGGVGSKDFGALKNLALAAGTLVFIICIYRFFRGRFLSSIGVLLGLVVGTGVAAIFGIPDFSGVGDAKVLGVTTPLHFGSPHFKLAAIFSMILVMFITAVETTGDVFATGDIVGKRIRREDIARAIRGDGLATTLGGLLNAFPYTAFAENVGLVRLTRVRSRFVVATAGLIMILLGLFPKVAAVVAAIPLPVLGGAALVMFGTVAVIGIQTLGRVDFHDDRNVIIVAVSLGLALIPVVYPDFYNAFSDNLKIVFASGITMGSLSAIILNYVMNVLGGEKSLVDEVVPTPRHEDKLTVDGVNHLGRAEFVERFGPLFQGPPWIAEQAYGERPFADLYELRRAFQDAAFDAPPERQLELLGRYPDLGSLVETDRSAADVGISPEQRDALASISLPVGIESLRDQSYAGLDRLSPAEHEEFEALNASYRERFGFPFIMCVRENTKETILANGKARLNNPPAQERATALVEISKIANLRLLDIVDEPLELEPV